MKKMIFLSAILALSACANTMQGALQDTSNNIYRANEYVKDNPDLVEKTTQTIKRGGEIIGKGMKATGEYLQEMAQYTR